MMGDSTAPSLMIHTLRVRSQSTRRCAHVQIYICALLIHRRKVGLVHSHSHGKPWPRWNVHMSPSGPGRRSTDPRIHCRHTTERDSSQTLQLFAQQGSLCSSSLCVYHVDIVVVLQSFSRAIKQQLEMFKVCK